MKRSRARASATPGVKVWSQALLIGTMILAVIALPVGFVLQLPLILGLSLAGIVIGGIALTS